MNKNSINLNLARKWRPSSFDEVIGQEIPIRTLQNGLYLKKFFPVYLFAGQRGCGKTSTARIFGAAANCQNLKKFQKNPQIQIPCQSCKSCVAMQKNNHPDFIEIDAASHTGVDNVRQILENCSYMPLAGKKKIYLIDEAHMLSKAAFNAFLKILEEPPKTVLFILATTEKEKIPQTVLSRCFQVIFQPIKNDFLRKHLKKLSITEKINIDDSAIEVILEESDGSVRDAINLLERIRFSAEQITQDRILKILGKISEKDFYSVFECIINQKTTDLLEILESINFQNLNPQIFWDKLIQTCRLLVWAKYKVNIRNQNSEKINHLAEKCSINRIRAILQLLWGQEIIFLQTRQKHIFIESVLIQICEQTEIKELSELIEFVKTNGKRANNQNQNNQNQKEAIIRNITQPNKKIDQKTNAWNIFLQKISDIADPMLESILKQAEFRKLNTNSKLICISLSNNSTFFKEKIEETKDLWIKILHKTFPGYNGFTFAEKTESEKLANTNKFEAENQKQKFKYQSKSTKTNNFSSNETKEKNISTEISNKKKWPKTNLILKHFPGRIKVSK